MLMVAPVTPTYVPGTDHPRVLFVCTGGARRSATAAAHFAAKYGWNTRAQGCGVTFAVVPLCDTTCRWADAIYCMEESHSQHVIGNLPEVAGKVKTLGIPDNYAFGDEALKAILEDRLKAVGMP